MSRQKFRVPLPKGYVTRKLDVRSNIRLVKADILDMYWDEATIDEVCIKWDISETELKSIFLMYKRHVAQHMNRLNVTQPLYLQYTGYRIPGAGYFLLKKSWLTWDLIKAGIITQDEFPKWKFITKMLKNKEYYNKSIKRFFARISKLLKVEGILNVK